MPKRKLPLVARRSLVQRIVQRLSERDEDDRRSDTDTFTRVIGLRCAEELVDLEEQEPIDAAAIALSLFLGLSWSEAAEALDFPEAAEDEWELQRDLFRENLGTPVAVHTSKRRIRERPKALVTLARNPLSGSLVAAPIGVTNKYDKRLARAVSAALRRKSMPTAALETRLCDFSCLISVSNYEHEGIPGRVTELLRNVATGDISSIPFGYYPVGLTIIEIGDIRRYMDRTGPRPKKEKQTPDTTKETVPADALLPKAELSMKEIYELLASAPVSDPTQVLVTVSRLIRALHEDLVAPAIQSCLDRIQVEVASLPGGNLGSFERNKAFVDSLRALLDRMGVRLECPTCRQPASLILQRGSTRNGRFTFHHRVAALRTNHGGKTSLPSLRVISPTSTDAAD